MSWVPPLLLLVALQVPRGLAQDMEPELELAASASTTTGTVPTTTGTVPTTTGTVPRTSGTTPTTTRPVPTSTTEKTTRTSAGGGSTTATPDRCKPDCSLVTPDNPKVPDPLDCHKLYVCVGGAPTGPLDCPDSEYFSTSKRDCVPNEAEECEALCHPGTGASCSYKCDAGTKYLSDRFDCSSYYDCADITTVLTCGDDKPFFDGNECQTEEKQCCYCKPYCYSGDKNNMVIDPLDCTKYYFCMEDNEVPEYSARCSDGNFDPFSGTCSTTVPCFTLCTNVINPQGCIDVFTCHEEGYFAACPNQCDPRYYHCTSGDIDSTVTADTCPGDDVFIADTTHCIDHNECPYEVPAF